MEKRPPYLIKRKNRAGETVWYVWKRPAPQIRIRGEYGSRGFMKAYREALYGAGEGQPRLEDDPDTLAALIAAYRRSPAWKRLAAATRKQRGNMLDRLVKSTGDVRVARIDRTMIIETRDEMSGPGAAKCFIDTLRGLFKWAAETGKVDESPIAGVKVVLPKTEGYYTWRDEDIAAYERKWPVGSRERLWLALLIYTGLRRSDAVRLGPANVVGGVIETVTGKTRTPIAIPLHPDLNDILAASPLGEDTFIGLADNTFGKLFRKACDAAGVSGSAHGLRKAAATRLGEAGATVLELNAVFGWTGAKMALRYTEKSDRARLARSGMERLKRVTAPKSG